MPNAIAREAIFKIHSRSLNIEKQLNIKKLVELTENATGADIKAICTEAGMFAIRRDSELISEVDFLKAVAKVMHKSKEDNADTPLYT
jgi:proteasome regulatory subunit